MSYARAATFNGESGDPDATVYLVLFLSMSGIYLWVVLRSERKAGLILLIAGAVSFGGIIYVVVA